MILLVALRILIHLIVQIECFFKHLVLLLVGHFAETFIGSFTFAQVDGLDLA